MATRLFGSGDFKVEVTTRTNIAMTGVVIHADDVDGDGQLLMFQKAQVIVDFRKRTVLEHSRAWVQYRILYRGNEVFAMSGRPGARMHRGGTLQRSTPRDRAYRF